MLVQDFEHRGLLKTLSPYLRRFHPRFERLSTRLSGGTILLHLHEEGFTAPLPAMRISDGTLRFIALLLVLLDPTPPPLVCIEEPELGLHPDALGILAELLEDASTRTQLIVTTHSEAMLSRLEHRPDAVLVAEHVGGGTRLERLDPDRFKFWIEKYGLGDAWRMGALGGNP